MLDWIILADSRLWSLWTNSLFSSKYLILAWTPTKMLESLSSLSSSRTAKKPAQKKTLVWPNLYLSWLMSRPPMIFSTAFLLSMNSPSGQALGFKILYLSLTSAYIILFGKPCLQIRIPSSTPLHLSW